jgi:hypothetical protein
MSKFLAVVAAVFMVFALSSPANAVTQQDRLVSYVENSGYVNKVGHRDFSYTWTRYDGTRLEIPTLTSAVNACGDDEYCQDYTRLNWDVSYVEPTHKFHRALKTLAPLYPACSHVGQNNCYTDHPGSQDTLTLGEVYYYLPRPYSNTH